MGLTFEKVWAALMEMREESKETDQRLKETDRLMRELRERQQETARVVEETSRELRASQQETDRALEKTTRAVEETTRVVKETTRVVEETSRVVEETSRVVKETSQSVGGLNNSFGELAEHLVAPNIAEKFNALGYHFKGIGGSQKIRNERGQVIAEIDILLENGDSVVAVEVKSRPKNADIENFTRRLEILRKFKDEIHDKRRIRGAIAGAVFQDTVKKAVLKAGFYVIEQSGDTVKINIPEGFKPKEW
jgi:hypothetical protein